jgi:outer membrane protein insertion porin family
MDRRIAAGFDIFHKQNDNTRYARYETWVTGGTIRFGIPLTDELTISPRWSLFTTRVKVPNEKSRPYNDCAVPVVGVTPGTAGAPALDATNNCLSNGEASLAVKEAVGRRLTSMPGYSIQWNTLDNNRNPTSGWYAEFRQDIAGAGGDAKFIRTTGDLRVYRELYDDVVGFVRFQAGHMQAFGGDRLRIVDNFNLGPSLVRGFAPGGIGPRDISDPNNTEANGLGGSTYVGGSVEVQFPILGLPREVGLKGALFADAGTLFGYKGRTNFSELLGLPANSPCTVTNAPPNYTQGNCISVYDSHKLRASVGASIIWASPLGPIRFDFARAVSKAKYDVTQFFRFSGGTSF